MCTGPGSKEATGHWGSHVKGTDSQLQGSQHLTKGKFLQRSGPSGRNEKMQENQLIFPKGEKWYLERINKDPALPV